MDTGAEVNLINPNLLDPALFKPSPHPVRLGVANSHLLQGGHRQFSMILTFQGRSLDSNHWQNFSLPFVAYDAAIVCDIILSYGGWLSMTSYPTLGGMAYTFMMAQIPFG